jgi:hypothetical protein
MTGAEFTDVSWLFLEIERFIFKPDEGVARVGTLRRHFEWFVRGACFFVFYQVDRRLI